MSSSTQALKGVRQRGNGWQVRVSPFTDVTWPTVDEANEYVTELRRRKRQGILTDPPSSRLTLLTVAQAARAWLTHVEQVGGAQGRPYGPEGMRAARRDARPWTGDVVVAEPLPVADNGRPFAELPLSGLDVGDIDRYLEARQAAAPRAAVGEWQALRNILLLAQRRGESFDARLLSLDVKRRKPRKRMPLTRSQLQYMAPHAPEYIRRALILGSTLGLRLMELLQADESWLDLRARTLTVPWQVRKGRAYSPGEDLVIDLLDDEVVLLREQLLARGGPSTLLFPRKHGTQWQHSHFWHKVAARARHRAALAWRDEHGLDETADTPFEWLLVDDHGRPLLDAQGEQKLGGFTPHDLRRGAATVGREMGLSVEAVAYRLGHKDGGTLLLSTYEAVRRDRVRAEVRAVDRDGGIDARLKLAGIA